MVDADGMQLEQARCGTANQRGQPMVGQADLLVELLDALGDRAQRRLEAVDRVGKGGLVGP